MAELRPGGLALIISSINPENVGKVVVTISRDESESESTWNVRTADGGSLMARWSISGKAVRSSTARCLARKLMPIDGDDFTYEDEREKELVNG